MSVHVFDSPEAACRERCSFRAFRQVHGAGVGFGREAERARGEGSRKALKDGVHGGQTDEGEEEDEKFGNGLQFGR